MRTIFQKLALVAFTLALLTALAKPASAQMYMYSGRVIGVGDHTITLLDAAGNQHTYFIGDATSGLANLQIGNSVNLSLFPGSTVVSNVALVRNAEFDPAVNPYLYPTTYYRTAPYGTPVYYYPSSVYPTYPSTVYPTYPYNRPLIRIRF